MNALGATNSRRIPIRQRALHPSMLGCLDISSSSSSDPGQSLDLSPYTDMKSLYFDDSLYENAMHYKIKKYLEENPLDKEYEELIIKCDSEKEYNAVLDSLFKEADGKFRVFGVSNNPMEIVVEPDPRDKYRKFNEDNLMSSENTNFKEEAK